MKNVDLKKTDRNTQGLFTIRNVSDAQMTMKENDYGLRERTALENAMKDFTKMKKNAWNANGDANHAPKKTNVMFVILDLL